MQVRVGWLLVALAAGALGCEPSTAPPLAEGTPDAREGHGTRDLVGYGEDLDAAVEIAPGIYQARGTANAQMVATSEGNVVIDTGPPHPADWIAEPPARGVTTNSRSRHLVLTHAHADHYGAADAFTRRRNRGDRPRGVPAQPAPT